MFTARYGLIPYVKQITFIFEKDNSTSRSVNKETRISRYRRCLTQYTLHGVTERSVGDLSQVVYELFPVNHGAWIGVITGCIPWNTRKYSCDVVIDCRLCTLDSCIDCTCIFFTVLCPSCFGLHSAIIRNIIHVHRGELLLISLMMAECRPKHVQHNTVNYYNSE